MQEITDFSQRLKAQRKTATIAIGALLIGGFSLTLPLWNDSTKYSETLFCFEKKCTDSDVKRGITHLIQRERRNKLFDANIKIISELPAEAPTAPLYGVIGSIALLGAYGVSKSLTDAQEKAIHSEFSLLKVKALENDMIAQNHLDLTQFSKAKQSEITKQAIARNASETIEAMKSENEQQLDHINGQLQGQIAFKSHELQLSEMDKQIADNRLHVAETTKKLDRLSDTKQDSKQAEKTKSEVEIELELDTDYLWYNRVLNEPCKVITGVSGSGKSTMEHALIQLARQDNQHTLIIYPNTTRTARDNSTVLSDADTINEFLAGFTELIIARKNDAKAKGIDEDDYLDYLADKRGMAGKIAIFAMEINNWEASGVNPELIAKFYKLCFTDVRKWGVTLTMTGQSINQGSVASELKSFSKLLGQQTKIECQSTTCEKTGKTISKGVALVKYSDSPEPQELKLVFYKPKNKTKY